jgi:hypothetical protein
METNTIARAHCTLSFKSFQIKIQQSKKMASSNNNDNIQVVVEQPPPAAPPTTTPITVESIQRCCRSLRRNIAVELLKGVISFCIGAGLVGANSSSVFKFLVF